MVVIRSAIRRAAPGAALVLLLAALPAKCDPANALLQFLQPGSRPSLALGGDPFLSPLSDELGWWRTLDPGAGSRIRFIRTENAPITPRLMQGDGRLTGHRSDLIATRRYGAAERSAVIMAGLTRQQAMVSWNPAANEATLNGHGTGLMGGARLSNRPAGLTMQVAGPIWQDNDATTGATTHLGLRYAWKQRLTLQLAWERSNEPVALAGLIENEPIAASLNLRREALVYDGNLRLWGGVIAEGRYRRTLTMRKQAITNRHRYEVAPDGTSVQHQIGLIWRHERRGGLLARLTQLDHDLGGDAFWGGLRFGELNYARFDIRSLLLAGEFKPTARSRILFEREQCELEGAGRLEIESWPFTSGLVDLLGLRRIYRGTAHVDWTRWHLGCSISRSDKEIRLGLTWYRLEPQAHLVSWRPLFLVFGRTDVRTWDLDISRIDLAALSAGIGLPLGRFACNLSFLQFFHAKIDRIRTPGPGSPGPGIETPAPTPHGWIGGSYAIASLELAW